MFWKRGWLLNTLSYIVQKNLRDTLYKNQAYLKNRWSTIEKLIIWGSKHIVIMNLIIISIAGLFAFLVSSFYTSDNDFQTIIYNSQVNFLSVIFPLVIAFIGIILQGKSANESLWIIFKHNSGFMLVGFSTLSLTAGFVILKISSPLLSMQVTDICELTIIFWFLSNLLMSGWFLWKMIEFVSLERRMKMIVKYAINDVIANDIKQRLLDNYPLNAKQAGLLIESINGKFEIATFSTNDQPYQILKESKNPIFIKNIWYRILNLGIWIWSIKPRLQYTSQVPVLCIPSITRMPNSKSLLIASSDYPIGKISSFLIRQSFRLSSNENSKNLNINNIIGALFSNLEDSLKDKNFRAFESAKDNLEKFFIEIQSCMHFINDSNESDNWLLLPEGKWFGRNILNEFISESISISKIVTQMLQEDPNYYETWCYFYVRLYSGQKSNYPKKIIIAYIDGHLFIWEKLLAKIGGREALDSFVYQSFDKAIKHFVSSWEHWSYLIDDQVSSIESRDFEYALHHLSNTSCMVVQALKYDSSYAAKWAIDVLINWYECFVENYNDYSYYVMHDLITTVILKYKDVHPLWNVIASFANFNQSEASIIALENYCADIRFITAAYLMGSPKYIQFNIYKECVHSILTCRRLDPTGSVETDNINKMNVNDILGSYLRLSDCWGQQHDYFGLFEQQLNKLESIEEISKISGRVYSRSGSVRERYIPIFFKVICIGYTSSKIKLEPRWINSLKSNNLQQRGLEKLISVLQELTVIDALLIKYICHQFNLDHIEVQRRCDFFVKSIQEIIATLKASLKMKVINAAVDDGILEQLSMVASASTFTLSDGPLPIYLFQDIDYLDDLKTSLFETNFVDFNKSYISKGIDVDHPINEDEWFNQTIRQRASFCTFHHLINSLNWENKEYEDMTTLILQVLNDAEDMKKTGSTPIMFIGSNFMESRINESKMRYMRKEDKLPFNIYSEIDNDRNYICHIENIKVFRIPQCDMNFCLLLPLEAFKKINVKHFGDGKFVDVAFKSNPKHKLTGTLSLYFGIECEFDAEKCFKYNLTQ